MGYINEDYYYNEGYGTDESSSTTTLNNKSTVCRYHQAGNCRRGSSCPFVHAPMSDRTEAIAITHPAYHGERIYAYPPPEQTPVYSPPISQTYSHFLWQPYPPVSHSFDPRYGVLRQPDAFPDYPDDTSDSYSSGSGSSTNTTSLEDARKALTNLRVDSADLAITRGMPSYPGDSGVAPSPGYVTYSYPAIPAVKAEYGVGRSRVTSLGRYLDQRLATTFPSPYLLPWQDDSKKKPLAYKTKPCKFYAMNGKCTSGDKCTFIHDPESDKGNEKMPREIALPDSADLPAKPVDKYEDLKARDFYPITWRVIGGGVMMGGHRQICPAFVAGQCKYGDDCKLAHETDVEADRGFVELKNDIVRDSEQSPRQSNKGGGSSAQRRKTLEVESRDSKQPEDTSSTTHRPPNLNLPDPEETPATPRNAEETKVASSKSPTSPTHRRTQSMTIVASLSPHDKASSTYAAEL